MREQIKILKYNICAKTAILLAVLLLTASFVFPVYAYTPCRCDLKVSQAVDVKGGYSKPFIPVSYSIQAGSSGAPLPGGDAGGVHKFTIKGNSSRTLSIDFVLPGEYSYTIYQHKPRAGLGYSHDNSVYRVYVSVTDSPSGLTAKIKLRRDGDSYKPAGIDFKNNFKPPSNFLNVKTGDTCYLWTWLAISLTTALVFSLILLYRRRKRKDGPVIKKN